MKPVAALHPGQVLLEELLERDWTLSSLAKNLDMDRDELRDFLLGVEPITHDLGKKIATLIGSSEDLWTNLQSSYDAFHAAKAAESVSVP